MSKNECLSFIDHAIFDYIKLFVLKINRVESDHVNSRNKRIFTDFKVLI